MKLRTLLYLSLIYLIAGSLATAQKLDTPQIPAAELLTIQQSYDAASSASTKTKKRRAHKKVVRTSKSLLKKYPESDDRYKLLELIFKCQQKLLIINNTKKNRENVFDTAKELVKAPMKFSKIRLQPDILLLRSKLAKSDMTAEERASNVRELVKLYFETEAEVNCLMYLTMLAKDLENTTLFKELKILLSTRFSRNPEATTFLRERFGESKRDLRFTGNFRNIKGQTISFPQDLIGYNYIICFWSKNTPDLKKRFSLMKEYQEKTNGTFKIFSFNTDELEDAGLSILDENSLDWTPMHLPKGINSKAFLGFGHTKSSYTLLPCNAMGYSLGKTSNERSDIDIYAILNNPRYLSLMQAFSIGHFLISESKFKQGELPTVKLNSLKALFSPIQYRYRLSNLESIENYRAAIKLCDEIIRSHSSASNLWKIRNSKIIALLGIWKTQLSTKHIEMAVTEAKLALKNKNIPTSAKVIPQFCIAKNALRAENAKPKEIIKNFILACGGTKANAATHAAAVILSIDGGQTTRNLYLDHRCTILEKFKNDQSILPVTSYLLKDLYSQYLFQADEKAYYSGQTSIYPLLYLQKDRDHIIHQQLDTQFTAISGNKIRIPDDNKFHFHICTFLDLPKNAASEVNQIKLINSLIKLAGSVRRKDIKPVLFFLSQDTEAITTFLEKHKIHCEAVSLQGGLDNPILTKLAIFSPEDYANTTLIGPTGDIIINFSKLHHQGLNIRRKDVDKKPWFDCMSSGHVPKFLKFNTSKYDSKIGHKAYKNKNWKLAVRHLSLTFSGQKKALKPNLKELKKALLESKDPKANLDFINHSLANHKKPQYGIYRYPWGLYMERAKVYDQLGETKKATADRKYAAELKIKDDAAVAKFKKSKQNAIESTKKRNNANIKATKERLERLKKEKMKKQNKKKKETK